MKLVSFKYSGRKTVGLWFPGGVLDCNDVDRRIPQDMVSLLEDWNTYGPMLHSLADTVAAGKLPLLSHSSIKLLSPVPKPYKLIAVGLNYTDHAHEAGVEVPPTPIYFAKTPNAATGPYDPIVIPKITEQVDYEAELAVVIGKRGKHIPESAALEYVAGYMAFNDVSARDMQFGDRQWFRGKSCDTFAPMGPYLVTRDEVPEPQSLKIELRLNGRVMQSSNTSQMVFSVARLISFLSKSMTLEPGDVIATGTPAGVGYVRKPPVFLRAGDIVEVDIEGVGTLRNPVIAEQSP